MSEYILAHDLGTSGNKATLYDTKGKLMKSAVCSYETYYPAANRAEQNPEDWWRAVCVSTKRLLEETAVNPASVVSVSFSGQMQGCLVLDQQMKPLRPMIIWADTRAEEQERKICERIGAERGYEITGHRISASYSAAKLMWIRENEPDIFRKTAKMMQAKDYMIYLLTGEAVTDYSDASATNLMDISKKEWSDDLLRVFEFNRALLPELYPSTHIAGYIHKEAAQATGLTEGTPVVIGGGDGSCACVGAGVTHEGQAYNVLGSSSWISTAASRPLLDKAMRTFNFVHLDENLYAPCGTMQAAGLSWQWYKKVLGTAEEMTAERESRSVYEVFNEAAAASPPGANHLLYLPYLLGERSPHWNIHAKGCFVGLDMMTEKTDMTRAVLEGVGYNLKLILDVLEQERELEEMIVIGGGARGRIWLQILADIWGKQLAVPRYLEEATSMGAAICGGVGAGVFEDFSVIRNFNSISEYIKPNSENAGIYSHMFQAFNQAYDGLKTTFDIL